MKSYTIALLVILLTIATQHCATGGAHFSANTTNVELGESNYKIIAKNISGKADAGYILGYSFPMGPVMSTFALAKIHGSGHLYHEAMTNLWSNFEHNHQKAEGKSYALVNMRVDTMGANWLLLYSQPTLVITADVIEFTGE